MIEALVGNRTASRVLLYLHDRGSGNPTAMARETGIPLNMIQKQLDRFARGGIAVAWFEGKRKFYALNKKLSFYRPLARLLGGVLASSGVFVEPPDPADVSHLSLRERVRQSEQLFREAVKLNPYKKYRPFVRSFKTLGEYERWRKKQSSPWCV